MIMPLSPVPGMLPYQRLSAEFSVDSEHCYGLTHPPQSPDVENLTPNTSKCDLIWRQDL